VPSRACALASTRSQLGVARTGDTCAVLVLELAVGHARELRAGEVGAANVGGQTAAECGRDACGRAITELAAARTRVETIA